MTLYRPDALDDRLDVDLVFAKGGERYLEPADTDCVFEHGLVYYYYFEHEMWPDSRIAMQIRECGLPRNTFLYPENDNNVITIIILL